MQEGTLASWYVYVDPSSAVSMIHKHQSKSVQPRWRFTQSASTKRVRTLYAWHSRYSRHTKTARNELRSEEKMIEMSSRRSMPADQNPGNFFVKRRKNSNAGDLCTSVMSGGSIFVRFVSIADISSSLAYM